MLNAIAADVFVSIMQSRKISISYILVLFTLLRCLNICEDRINNSKFWTRLYPI